jgi:hypothetical protein
MDGRLWVPAVVAIRIGKATAMKHSLFSTATLQLFLTPAAWFLFCGAVATVIYFF